jgi:hypothetical protein
MRLIFIYFVGWFRCLHRRQAGLFAGTFNQKRIMAGLRAEEVRLIFCHLAASGHRLTKDWQNRFVPTLLRRSRTLPPASVHLTELIIQARFLPEQFIMRIRLGDLRGGLAQLRLDQLHD